MNEANLMRSIQVAVSKVGARIFRNNVGLGWVGQQVKVTIPTRITIGPGDILLKNARPFHAGLCEGSSDLIGWTPIKITQDMVGKTFAVFTAVEVKTPIGKATEIQQSVLAAVKDAGGISFIGRSETEALEGLRGQIGTN